MRRRRLLVSSLLSILALGRADADPGAEVRVAAISREEVDVWGARLAAWTGGGRLRLARTHVDEEFPDRRVQRYEQLVGGVPVWGTQLVAHTDGAGRTVAVFGTFTEDLRIDTRPRLRPEQAERIAAARAGTESIGATPAELVVVPVIAQLGNTRPHLAYVLWTQTEHTRTCHLIDAHDGAILLEADDTQSAAAAGLGTGAHGVRRKLAVERVSETEYRALDRLRPPDIRTYDLGFDTAAHTRFNATGVIADSLIAKDADNEWTDGMATDVHAYLGATYDYFFKRHGRRGIDDRNLRVIAFIHHSRFANASWNRVSRSMLFGDGAGSYGPFTGLDVVAHEFTHGVTQHSWGALPLPQAGALNESFSDMMGIGAEWFHQPAGNDWERADYWIGEDCGAGTVFSPRFGFRAPFDPSMLCRTTAQGVLCHPDHFSRYSPSIDIHSNGEISTHAYYLLIEGGTNRTSGIRVAGLGPANRERAEKIFYRGFTAYLTPTATFLDARRATIQAARDLYGAGSVEAEQTALAWTAVGVVEG